MREYDCRMGGVVLYRLYIATVLGFLAMAHAHAHAGVVVTTVCSFDGTNQAHPLTPLIQAADGTLYGTTDDARNNGGTIFSLPPSGQLKTVAAFSYPNGWEPLGTIVQTGDGSLYGTTWLGGTSNIGSIFRVSTSGELQYLFSFTGTNGSSPTGLIHGPDGALYGVTQYGGLASDGTQRSGLGTVFRIDTNGTFATVLNFNGTNGALPYQLLLAQDGSFYGTTVAGGASMAYYPQGVGTVYRLIPRGPLTTLHCFDTTNGAGAFTMVQGVDGDLYGVTLLGGSTATSALGGYGTIFRLTTNGVFSKLADCTSSTYYPMSIVQAADGGVYGTALGVSGSLFRVDPGGVLRVVHDFNSGYAAPANLVRFSGAAIYGTTGFDGAYSAGTIFRVDITPDPPLAQLVEAQGGQVILSWNASVGHSYQVQSCADVLQGWTNAGSAFVATNTTTTISQLAAPWSRAFYRVVLLP